MTRWIVVRINVFTKDGSEPMFELDMQGPYNDVEQADMIKDDKEWEEQTDEAAWYVVQIQER